MPTKKKLFAVLPPDVVRFRCITGVARLAPSEKSFRTNFTHRIAWTPNIVSTAVDSRCPRLQKRRTIAERVHSRRSGGGFDTQITAAFAQKNEVGCEDGRLPRF